MNAVEIEEAISELVQRYTSEGFDADNFPFDFLAAFGNPAATLKRLRATGKSSTNQSTVGGVLQSRNIHLKLAPHGEVGDTLRELVDAPETAKRKCKFALATDGQTLEAENLTPSGAGETLACDFADLPDRFGFFLELAGIRTVKAIRENAFDVKATGRLNKLYVELLRHNPEWGTADRREDMNHFMARLIFCFFAEDTGIFLGESLFSNTVQQMSESDASNTHEVVAECFRAMNTPANEADRSPAVSGGIRPGGIRPYANGFPYVNGGLFGGEAGCSSPDGVPRFTKIARSYLIHIGSLDWTKINPDIFGSMIQAVADDEERGALGMHYTSVPNILKVLNPLFLDELREKLDTAGDRPQALRHLRKRLARIRVFDPACGSGNFLVIAYKQMRGIEFEINQRLGEAHRSTDIPLTNFRGIELRHFAAEIARLALVIAEYQCDVTHRGQKLALAEFLPLDAQNWITCGNALRLDWLQICPPTGTETDIVSEHMFEQTQLQARIDFQNEGGETYICGNPPYVGRRNQTKEQKREIKEVLAKRVKSSASLDYVFCWIEKASDFVAYQRANFAFVTTNSVAQGSQIPIYWPQLLARGLQINFAHRSFRWSNNAADNAGVTCVILGIGFPSDRKIIFDDGQAQIVSKINPYLFASDVEVVEQSSTSIAGLPKMRYGNMPADGNQLTVNSDERRRLLAKDAKLTKFMIPLYGAKEFIRGLQRYCLWINDADLKEARSNDFFRRRIDSVQRIRRESKDSTYNKLASKPHQFRERYLAKRATLLLPIVSSESRPYLPTTVLPGDVGTTNATFALYDAPLWNMALIASRMHLVWIGTVCGKLKTDYRYSNTLGWNTFPVPTLTDQNKHDLTRCAEDILLAREQHWPATIADMYDPKRMDDEFPGVRAAHERNDETLERIYIGKRFKNDTQRLEHLFDLYTKMTAPGKE